MDYIKLARSVHESQNELRRDPPAFAAKLEAMLKYFNGTLYEAPGQIALRTNEGVKAVKECIEVLKKTKPLPELAFDDNISKACKDHVDDSGPKGKTGHNGSNGSEPWDRMKKYGSYGAMAENISYGCATGDEIVISLVVDDGVPSRGHRKNMLSSSYSMVGIACGPHKTYRHMAVLDYASSAGSFGSCANAIPIKIVQSNSASKPTLAKAPTTQKSQPVRANSVNKPQVSSIPEKKTVTTTKPTPPKVISKTTQPAKTTG